MSNKMALPGLVYVCGCCGKRSRDKNGTMAIDQGWDESCMLNAVLCFDSKRIGPDGPYWQAAGNVVPLPVIRVERS